MKKTILTLLFSFALSFNASAEPADSVEHTNLDIEIADLSSQIGSTMSAYYQSSYHDQVVVISTLKYCGVEDKARKVVDSFPDLPSFYLQKNPHQLLYDMVYKEALIGGYDLHNDEEFELVLNQSLIKGQSFFWGYLKGYQTALGTFFDKKVMKSFCDAAIVEADKYIVIENSVSQVR